MSKGRKLILVTGGAGHVGSHVIEELVKDPDNRVISLDNYFNGSVKNHIQNEHVEYRHGSTADIFKLVPETPDIIYHLGEYARIIQSFDEPDKVFEMNTHGAIAVVEFCRKREIKKLVYAASSTKFGDDGNGGEGRSHSPYTFSKAQNVDLVKNYGKWYNLNYAICYFFNAFGPREVGTGKYATLIAKFEQLYLKGEAITVTRPGTQGRNFTYVKDIARGMVLVGEKGVGDGYALNNTKFHTMLEVAEAFGCGIKMIGGDPGRSGRGDLPTKAREELGWETTVDVMDYIKDFVKAHPRASSL